MSGNIFGEPISVDAETTIIPVSRTTRSGRDVPVGVLTIRDGATSWTPVTDTNTHALVGLSIGFAATVLSCIAVIRRPPWPQLVLHSHPPVQ